MTIWRTFTCCSHRVYHAREGAVDLQAKEEYLWLEQAPRQWYLMFDRFMMSSGFTRLEDDHCCYSKWLDNSYIMQLLYVDDMLVAGSSMKDIVNLKANLTKNFSMKDLDPARKFLGMRINRERKKTVESITDRVHEEGVEEI